MTLENQHKKSIVYCSLPSNLNLLATKSSITTPPIKPSFPTNMEISRVTTPTTIESTELYLSIENETKLNNLTDNVDIQQQNSSNLHHDSDTDFTDDEDDETKSRSFHSLSQNDVKCTDCPICFESTTLYTFSCCKFECCDHCRMTHIETLISEGQIQISCPSSQCNKNLSRESIINLISSNPLLYQRYIKLYTKLNENSRAKTCPRCSYLYSLDTMETNALNKKRKVPTQVKCPHCSLIWCFRCSAPWHEDLTCKQFRKGEKSLLKWMNTKSEHQWNARRCPKCSTLIQRNGGCPHMTCGSCRCSFCYNCGRRYVKIPVIGKHTSKYSIFGCPNNLYPNKPWLRRLIRGSIAIGTIAGTPIALPIAAIGGLIFITIVLPAILIYKAVKS